MAFVSAVAPVHAQDWPNRALRFIVPAGPGSSLDVLARIIGERLRDSLAQPVLVDNRPAGGGTVGVAACAQAAPDGHTMVIGFNGPLSLAPFLYAKLPYAPTRDLVPVIVTSTSPNILAVNAELPVRSVKELVAYARSNSQKLAYASVGNASSSHLTMELFKSVAGFHALHSPYNGAPPAAASVAQNETQLVFAAPTALNAHLKSGRLRALAVSSSRRDPLFPDLPTLAEQGYPKFEAMLWNGILVPAGTPKPIVSRLNADVNAILVDADARRRIAAAGLEPGGGTPEAFGALIGAESARWAPVIRQLGLTLD
ncbi:MAG: tripartite tricarboxylate transporter substrate binding protein [Proteobacteria bacterium]|nr:tripartite tricarboxylate transporter substrate binding protein [Burkholderiales bacterium]